MNKPDDIAQEAWDAAGAAWPYFYDNHGPDVKLVIARAIMSAEKRGAERERQACAQIADEMLTFLNAEHAANPSDGPFVVKGGALASKHIAAAIRARNGA